MYADRVHEVFSSSIITIKYLALYKDMILNNDNGRFFRLECFSNI